ncbi:lysylphosphatidylglycerol synthase transmembrane domain-containing protein [Georgenia daeguensis]|uniref:Lysylphosphatidylglycerol synthase transmembrane domain-containing protein n=1 Tax=Georgenia daeguensis TaxID=908355 RepID=A0ABP8ERP5_9MICO
MAGPAEPPRPEETAGRGVGARPAVTILDDPVPDTVHDPTDAIGVGLSLLGVALTMFLASFAHGTTTGLAADVQGLDGLLRQFVIVPAAILERVVALVVPLVVLAELVLRRAVRQAGTSLLAGVVGIVLCSVVVVGLREIGTGSLVRGLAVTRDGGPELTVPVSLSMVAALLTVAGPRGRRRSVAWSWGAVWVTVGISLVTAQAAPLGSALALLLGRATGLAVRYLVGVRTDRAYGTELADAVRRAGLEPVSITRRPAAGHRRYALVTEDGRHLELLVLDGDRQVVATLSRLWEAVRLREVGAPPLSARETAEHVVALTSLVRETGAGAPAVHAVAVARDSTVIVQDEAGMATALAQLPPEQVTDELLHRIWEQLRRVHRCGVAHRGLSSRTVRADLSGPVPRVWFTHWESGTVAASELLRRADLAQMLTLLALRVGTARAVASARNELAPTDLRALAALLQPVALPRATREELRRRREVLTELRAALVGPEPGADGAPEAGAAPGAGTTPGGGVEPVRLVRLGGRQAFTVTVAAVAVVVVLTTVNLEDISAALTRGDWRWSVAAFALGLLTFAGVATTYVALSPVRLPFWRAVRVQVAASFVALAAPAGLGPAALNVRMFTRRGVATALALATVALVQVSQFAVTVLLLVVLSVLSGASAAPVPTTSPATLVTLAAVVGTVGAALLIRPLREWLGRTVLPVVRQTWPLVVTLGSHPRRLALAVLGNAVTSLGWILALYCSLASFGEHLTAIQVAIVYFAGNAAGSVVPTPGGIGSIEVALIAGLTALGVGPGVAVSATVLFRVVTFWVQIPLGWVTLRHLMRRGAL